MNYANRFYYSPLGDGGFNNKVAIVTGAGVGIGFEICRQLTQNGASVLLNDIDETLTAKAAEEIKSEGGKCIGLPGDAGDVLFIQQMIKTAVNEFGQLNIAIANAGITLFANFFEYTPDSFFKVLRLNLGGSFFLAQQAARRMKEQQTGGSILFMSSVVGHQAHKNLAAYASTKAGLEMLAKNLVIELSPYKITVNAIAPGATMTERTMEDPDYKKTWERLNPLGCALTTTDIANAALFMVSDKAKHITGQSLVVDAGWSSISPNPD
jgi:glucose 1-dehydrogenase